MKNSLVKNAPQKTRAAKVETAAAHSHDHGDGVCCNHEHGPSCDFELGIRPYKPEDYRELKAVWKLGEIVTDDTSSARALKQNLEKRKGSFQVFVAEVIAINVRS